MREIKFDWDKHRGKTIKCKVMLRTEYKSREIKPTCKELDGKELGLYVLWHMDEGDPYPNEWALGERKAGALAEAGITWIASGDVEVINQ